MSSVYGGISGGGRIRQRNSFEGSRRICCNLGDGVAEGFAGLTSASGEVPIGSGLSPASILLRFEGTDWESVVHSRPRNSFSPPRRPSCSQCWAV